MCYCLGSMKGSGLFWVSGKVIKSLYDVQDLANGKILIVPFS